MLCKRCNAWELDEFDLYCGWCGVELLGLERTPGDDPLHIYLGMPPPTSVPLCILFSNYGHAPAGIEVMEQPAWLSIQGTGLSSIAPAGRAEMRIEVDPARLDCPADGKLTYRILPSNIQKTINIAVFERPEMVASPLTVFRGARSIVPLQLEFWEAPVLVEGVEFDSPFLRLHSTLPIFLDVGGGDLEVVAEVPESEAAKQAFVGARLSIRGIVEPVEVRCELTIQPPAKLQIPELDDSSRRPPRILPGIQEDFYLTLRNAGAELLRIEGVAIRSLEEVKGLALHPRFEPVAIDAGQEHRLYFKADCQAEPEAGLHYFELDFQSNDPSVKRNLRRLAVEVVESEYNDYVSIDFGTTDSSVAFLDAGSRQPVNLLLDGDDPKIYSNIFFMDYDAGKSPPFIWSIGKLAAQLGARQPKRCFKSIKSDIGHNRIREIHFPDKDDPKIRSHKLASEKVAQFVLMDLLNRSQRSLGKRLSRFILCVPTRFTLRKKDILKSVFTQAAQAQGIDLDRPELVDESLAAGLFYILMRGPKDELVRGKPVYTLMIVDFGGGTTDITVFQVTQQLRPDGRVKRIERIEILGAWGDDSLGGEGVTRQLARMLTERFLAQMRQRRPTEVEIRETSFRLEDEAEAGKIAISELLGLEKEGCSLERDQLVEKALGQEDLGSNLGYIWDATYSPSREQLAQCLEPYLKSRVLTVSSADFPGLKATLSQEEVVGIYRSKLERLEEELRLLLKRIGMKQVDVLLLAGQSSRFPTVRDVLGGLGRKVDYVRDAAGKQVLKECVSLGALLYSYSFSGKLDFQLTGHDKYWTRLGWDTFAVSEGQVVFEDVIPWGTQYPCRSAEFNLNDYHVRAGRLRLELMENLSLHDTPRMAEFATYTLDLNGTTQPRYPCRLEISPQGDVKAFCRLGEKWIKMERK